MINERGNAALYTLFFAPLVFGIGSIAYELSSANSFKNFYQSEVDRIALTSALVLPDRAAAHTVASHQLSQLKLGESEVQISIPDKSSEVGIEVMIRRSTLLLPLFNLLQSSAGRGYLLTVKAAAELIPVDAMIILSDGIDMRPALGPSGEFEDAWGDLNWKRSSFFNSCSGDRHTRYSNDSPISGEAWSTDIGQNWLTQTCFNPVFSRFKIAAMALADSIMAAGTNRLGFIFTPGNPGNEGVDLIRPLKAAPNSGFIEPGGVVKALWSPYQDSEFEVGDEACVLFSDSLSAPGREYSLESLRNLKSSRAGCEEPVRLPGCEESPEQLSSECLAGSSLPEVIYYRGAKRPVGGFPAKPELLMALGAAEGELLGGESGDASKIEEALRGNLSARPIRAIIIITDDLPPIIPLPHELEIAAKAGLSLLVVHVGRSDYRSVEVDSREQQDNALQWNDYLRSISFRQSVPNRLISVGSPDELISLALPQLAAAIHRVALES